MKLSDKQLRYLVPDEITKMVDKIKRWSYNTSNTGSFTDYYGDIVTREARSTLNIRELANIVNVYIAEKHNISPFFVCGEGSESFYAYKCVVKWINGKYITRSSLRNMFSRLSVPVTDFLIVREDGIAALDMERVAQEMETSWGVNTMYTFGQALPSVVEKNGSMLGVIKNYTANPLLFCESTFDKREDKTLPYYGIEWEMDIHTNNRDHHKTKEFLTTFGSKCIAKQDGSIPSRGAEFVFTPMSFEEIKNHLPAEKVDKFLKENVERNASCGMHIHISRAALTPSQIRHMIAFINHPSNGDFLNKVSGRVAGRYCNREAGFSRAEHMKPSGALPTAHSSALSFSSGKPTLELRIFSSPVTHKEMMKNVEFTDALVQFSREVDTHKFSSGDFLKWLQKKHRVAKYPNLYKHLRSKVTSYDNSLFLYGNYIREGYCAKFTSKGDFNEHRREWYNAIGTAKLNKRKAKEQQYKEKKEIKVLRAGNLTIMRKAKSYRPEDRELFLSTPRTSALV